MIDKTKIYREKHKNEINKRQREWRKLNPEQVKKFREKYKHKSKISKKIWCDKNILHIQEYNRKRTKNRSRYIKDIFNEKQRKKYRENIEYNKERVKIWAKNNPDKRLIIMKRHLEKYGKVFDMTYSGYTRALQYWSETIRVLDNNICKLCDSKENLHAHHIQPKALFPKLSLDLDNGITLCRECHQDIHGFILTTFK